MIYLSQSAEELSSKLSKIKCILLDWDGVFNNGFKFREGSGFSETDSMGLNLFRYFFYRQNGQVPVCALISGEKNDVSFYFAEREHLHACYFKIKDKKIALEDVLERYKLREYEVLYFFDDVLDLPVARRVGLRAYVHHPSREKFLNYLKDEKLFDIYSDLGGVNHALREIIEHLIYLSGEWYNVLKDRENYTPYYKEYIAFRNNICVNFLTLMDKGLEIITTPITN
ncbi:MAG: phosphatase [Bacteroidia bacterium]|nr:phosphatase [Bacteroidia bacterium]